MDSMDGDDILEQYDRKISDLYSNKRQLAELALAGLRGRNGHRSEPEGARNTWHRWACRLPRRGMRDPFRRSGRVAAMATMRLRAKDRAARDAFVDMVKLEKARQGLRVRVAPVADADMLLEAEDDILSSLLKVLPS
jgi:hypothetical protein